MNFARNILLVMMGLVLAILLAVSDPITTFSQGVATTAVVKPASIPPTTTDPALVVTISPNSFGAIADPCTYANKTTVPINNSNSSGTVGLVPASGSTIIYVCSFSVTISQVATTPNTLLFEYGFGANCIGSPQSLTGLFGAGGITAGPPISVSNGGGNGTIFKSVAGAALCAVYSEGATSFFEGFLTYVQQ